MKRERDAVNCGLESGTKREREKCFKHWHGYFMKLMERVYFVDFTTHPKTESAKSAESPKIILRPTTLHP